MNSITITNRSIVQDQMSKTYNNEEQYTKLARSTKTADLRSGKKRMDENESSQINEAGVTR